MHHHLIRLFVCGLILFNQGLPAAAQSPSKYKEIDDFIKGDQLKVTSLADIRVFGRELRRLFTDDEIKARAAFFWLTLHIKYDCEGYRTGNTTYEPSDVLAKGRAVCSGYARLMKLFCDELGVECEIISGLATGISVDKLNPDSMESNHDWNAVKIKGHWRLVDPTWGSGYASSGCKESWQQLENEYFLADPGFMICTHFPEEEKWQLLPEPYSARQFADSFTLRKKKEELYTPLDSVIRKTIGETIRLKLPIEDKRNFFMVMLYNKEGKRVEDLEMLALTGADGFYYCDYKVKRAGVFRVEIALFYTNGTEVGYTTTPIVTYQLQVTQPARQ